MLKFLRGGRRTAMIWWIIILGTAVSFIIGFSVAPNLAGRSEVSGSTVLGSVGGEPVTQEEWQAKYAELAQSYRLSRGSDPEGRDESQLREQAWVQLLTEKALLHEGRRLGYGASDAEVLYAVKNTPPPVMRLQPAFMTNGRFDQQKYLAALNDPNMNWAGLEESMREMLPGQKFEERIIASAKFSEPELKRAFRDQYEMATVTVARWVESPGTVDTTKFTDEVVRRYYDEHKRDFAGPEEVSASMVLVPKTFSEDDKAGTRERALAIVEQARGGADFSTLARDMSEAPNAAAGGDLGRDVATSELPPSVGQPVAAVKDSAILDPILEGSRYYVLKVRKTADTPAPMYRIYQIVLSLQPSEASRAADMETLERLRKEARGKDLGRVAAAMGLGAQETGWFTANTFVAQLVNLPQAQQFAVGADEGALSPAYDTDQAYVLLQVTGKRLAGVRPFDTVKQEVKHAAIRAEQLKPAAAAAERALQKIRGGMPFEEAARAENAMAVEQTQPFSRQSPAYQLSSSPRAVGVAFGLPMGQVAGPLVGPAGVLLIRKDAIQSAPGSQYDSLKANISRMLLSNRQQRGVTSWINWVRQKVGIKDLRGERMSVQ